MKNIFVGNLDFNTSEDELRQLFEVHGQVDRVAIMTDRDTGRSRGFGFVEMASAEDGEKATGLNDFWLNRFAWEDAHPGNSWASTSCVRAARQDCRRW